MRDMIEARLRQLQNERQQLAGELEQGRHAISAYDGAIGELSALLHDAAEPPAPPQEKTPAE